MKTVASIDIGTNTILLLVARVDRERLEPLFDTETIVRLGEGVHKIGFLSSEAMERGLRTLTQYLERCQKLGVENIFAVGTSALREASNSDQFLKMIRERLNLSIEIISGEEEARLSYLAVSRDFKELKESTLVIDVGGGSTEFIEGKNGHIVQSISLPLGAVRLTEQFLLSDPVREEEWKKMEERIGELLVRIPHPPVSFSMVAVGGTATTLASVDLGLKEFLPEKIHRFALQQEALRNQLHLFRSKTIDDRKKIPGLSPSRADVILAGGAILYMAMKELKCPSVLISCHGLRYGLLYDQGSLNFEF